MNLLRSHFVFGQLLIFSFQFQLGFSQEYWIDLMRKNVTPNHTVSLRVYGFKNNELTYMKFTGDIDNSIINLDASLETKVILHGWLQSCDEDWISDMAKSFFNIGTFNILCFTWLPNGDYDYGSIVERMNNMSILLATKLEKLGINFESTHLIGFSLGAHLAGLIGKQVEGIDRITGLDPARSEFEGDAKGRLDSTDASFVDVIHSEAPLPNNDGLSLGIRDQIGHVDFYPNDGLNQPGCEDFFGNPGYACSHRRAVLYFIASIDVSNVFNAFPCDAYENFSKGHCFDHKLRKKMGYYVDRSMEKNKLFLMTHEYHPYAGNQYQIAAMKPSSPLDGTLYLKFPSGQIVTLQLESDMNETSGTSVVSSKFVLLDIVLDKTSKIVVDLYFSGLKDSDPMPDVRVVFINEYGDRLEGVTKGTIEDGTIQF